MRFKYLTKTKRPLFFGFIWLILIEYAISGDQKENQWEPENWYQAEVVIFKHNMRDDDERPPTNFELNYPHNWIKLIPPEITIDVLDLAKRIEFSSDREVSELRRIDIKSKSNNEGLGVQTNIDMLDHVASSLGEVDRIGRNYPKFELPYIKLQKQFRNLNDTTIVLRRLPKYSVLCHDAWRFPIATAKSGPWIIVEAGSSTNSRFELEGSLRFYKSRFLHFESSLWFSETDTNFGARLNVNFPMLQSMPQGSLQAASSVQDSSLPNTQLYPNNITKTGANVLMSIPETIGFFQSTNGAQQSVVKNENQNTASNNQMVSELWTIDQSQRLKSSEVYYLDHPKIGIILTINNHQPLLLNSEEMPIPSTDRD